MPNPCWHFAKFTQVATRNLSCTQDVTGHQGCVCVCTKGEVGCAAHLGLGAANFPHTIFHQKLSTIVTPYFSPPRYGLGEITRTHAHSPRIFRTRALRGKYAENARRIRVSATRTFRVFSAHSPRNFRALKNFKKDPFFYFSKFFKILKSKKKSKKLKILKIFEKNHNFKKFHFFLNFKI